VNHESIRWPTTADDDDHDGDSFGSDGELDEPEINCHQDRRKISTFMDNGG
jgi:hypothetical protein